MFKIFFIRNNILMLFYIILTSVMILSRDNGFNENVQKSGTNIVHAFYVGLSSSTEAVGRLAHDFSRVWNMNRHYKKMQEYVKKYSYYEIETQRLRMENDRLRRLMGLPMIDGYRQVHAHITVRDAANLSSEFMINKGSKAGLEPKMLVLAHNEDKQIYGVVGRIQEVFTYSAKVVPLSYPESFLSVQLLASGYEGLVTGGSWSGDRLILRYVSRGALASIATGDLATTSTSYRNEESVTSIPYLYVGEVEEVIDDPTEVSLSIVLRSIIDLGRVRDVFILLPEMQAQLVIGDQLRSVENNTMYEDYIYEQNNLDGRIE